MATMMKEDYEEAMRQQQLQEEDKYKMSIQYQEELERQLEEQVCVMYVCICIHSTCIYVHTYVHTCICIIHVKCM